MMYNEDTISAVITALGEGAVGIVRISGMKATAVAESFFKASSGKILTDYPPNTLVYGHIIDEDDSIVDEVLAVFMRGPKSYTAEDVIEIQCHGSIQSLKKILELSYKAGARPAEPGEFSKRAFLNGRIDLAQAEAVMDIIKSRSEAALKLAARQQQGQLSNVIEKLRQEVVDIVVNLEAIIDYPEEDIEEITFTKVSDGMDTVKRGITELLSNAHTGKILREGLRTVIIGKPNVGKSSLLNSLLQEERAIVSEYAGTTRDVIEEQILIDGVPLVLADTAGIRQTEDYVEKIGVNKSRQLLQEAELAIVVLDGSQPLTQDDEEILKVAQKQSYVIIVNKSDLAQATNLCALQAEYGIDKVMTLSAKTTAGLDQFTAWLKNYVYGSAGTLAEGAYVQNSRHEQLLREALQSILEAQNAAAEFLPYDCLIIDLRKVITALGCITGATIQDEIINEIFSRFCIGK